MQILCFALAHGLWAAAQTRPTTARPLDARIDEVLASKYLRKSLVSVHVVDPATGRTLYSRQADQQMVPASNVKLVTTAAALDLLGATWAFQTHVAVDGDDLVLIGGGDPTISGRFADGDPATIFDRWIEELKQRGLTHVAGDVVVDDSYFDEEFFHPSWPKSQGHRWYCARVCALSLNDNCVDVHVAPGTQPGDPATARAVPESAYFELRNELKTGADATQHKWRLSRLLAEPTLVCDGLVAEEDVGHMTVPDPGLFFGMAFAEALRRQGVSLAGTVRRDRGRRHGDDVRIVLTHRTPLTTALVVANKHSQGFYCEQLLKTLGAELTKPRQPGSWANGVARVAEFLAKVGIQPGTYVMDDGSGLSRKNRFTARQFATLLAYMYRHARGEAYRGTLAVAGVDGTLRGRLSNDEVQGRVFAKSGYIAGVRSLSGYVLTREGRWLAFSFLANKVGSHGKVAANELCRILFDHRLP